MSVGLVAKRFDTPMAKLCRWLYIYMSINRERER